MGLSKMEVSINRNDYKVISTI